jgi:hypothetical protein
MVKKYSNIKYPNVLNFFIKQQAEILQDISELQD